MSPKGYDEVKDELLAIADAMFDSKDDDQIFVAACIAAGLSAIDTGIGYEEMLLTCKSVMTAAGNDE